MLSVQAFNSLSNIKNNFLNCDLIDNKLLRELLISFKIKNNSAILYSTDCSD